MKVDEKYFNLLKSGEKTIELRLFDEKRALIKVSDVLEFSNANDEKDCFEAVVVKLHRAESFEKLCNVIDVLKAGFDTKEELLKVLEEFYPLEKQNKYGVVGIEVEK